MAGYRPLPSRLADNVVLLAIGLLLAVVAVTVVARVGSNGHNAQTSPGATARVKSDLRNAAIAEETFLTDYDTYTPSLSDLESEGLDVSDDDVISVVALDGTQGGYCLSGTAPDLHGKTWYYDSEAGGLSDRPCGEGGFA
jgi:hypothetical protein